MVIQLIICVVSLLIVCLYLYFPDINLFRFTDKTNIFDFVLYHAEKLMNEVVYDKKKKALNTFLSCIDRQDKKYVTEFFSRYKNVPTVISMTYKVLNLELDKGYLKSQEPDARFIKNEILDVLEVLDPRVYDNLWAQRAYQYVCYKGWNDRWDQCTDTLDREYIQYRNDRNEISTNPNFGKEILPEIFLFFVSMQITTKIKSA